MLRDGMPVGVAKPCLAFVETNPSFFLLSSGFQIPPHKIGRFGQIAEFKTFDETRLAELLFAVYAKPPRANKLDLPELASQSPCTLHSLLDELQVTWRL